jgi:hypothetical protein
MAASAAPAAPSDVALAATRADPQEAVPSPVFEPSWQLPTPREALASLTSAPPAAFAPAPRPTAGPERPGVLGQPAAPGAATSDARETGPSAGAPEATSGPAASLAAPVPPEAAAYAAEATSVDDAEEDMGWEDPPAIGPDGRGPWLDGPDAPWGTAPSEAGRRAVIALVAGTVVGIAAAAAKLFLL